MHKESKANKHLQKTMLLCGKEVGWYIHKSYEFLKSNLWSKEEFCKDFIYVYSKKRIMLMRSEEKSLNLRENTKVELSLQNTMAAKKR